jgi:hypothetical protein
MIACALVACIFGTGAAQQAAEPPNFAPTPNVGWIAYGPEFIPLSSGMRPVSSDPKHPFVPNAIEILSGQPDAKNVSENSTFAVSDLSNPILQPWVREQMRELNERVLAGMPLFSKHASCWPMGVPAFLLYPVAPVYFIQTPREVLMTVQSDHITRHVYLNVPHSAHVKPSWFGESVGHYEGDTLVVDTIGMNDRTYIDEYRTPHTNRLHVIERFHLIEGGRTLEVNLHVEDPGAFTTPWDASQRYRRVEPGSMVEATCAENNANYFGYQVEPMPQANKPDF